MNLQRLQGLALILSAVCLLLGLFVAPAAAFFIVTSTILFIVGIPAIQSAQPTGTIGLVGIVLLVLAALIALGFRLGLVPDSLGSSLAPISALAGMLGAVIIGWLTKQEHVFPAWLGWAFIAQGLLNLIAGLLDFGPSAAIVLAVLQAVVTFAYGYFIYQEPVKPAIAGKYQTPVR